MTFKNHLLIAMALAFIVSGCSKKVETTPAKVKLSLSKIVNFSSGIGSGGAILYGKSSTGEQFGKILSGNEENLDLPNGVWSFYAFMWSKVSTNMSEVVYCGKSSLKLSGIATTISLSLNNANCSDPVYSGGDSFSANYSGNYKNKFASLFLEECDDLSKATTTCKGDNQGSASSYRFVFKNYKRASNGEIYFSNEALYGACVSFATLHQNGMQVNFPSGNSEMEFVASVEMFLGSSDCGVMSPENKGVYTEVFKRGIATALPTTKIVNHHGYNCSALFSTSDRGQCLDNLGFWSSGSCTYNANSNAATFFATGADCQTSAGAPTVTTTRYLKQMVAIPKSYLCRYNDSMNVGTDAFPGGNGNATRPYKICNEWQMNQIGENGTTVPAGSSFKLMNDLDMNRITQGVYPAIQCADNSGTYLDIHSNLNPLDGYVCTPGTLGFSGTFDGGGHTIYNARINSDSLMALGFVRELHSPGWIKNLNFKNIEVRGQDMIGSLAGGMLNGVIKDVNIYGARIEGKGFQIGGVAGETCLMSSTGSKVDNVQLVNSDVRGNQETGGLVGKNCGTIDKSSYSGIVRSEHSTVDPLYAGGLSGYNKGMIVSSFSEGLISVFATKIGGIAGKNEGTINSVYSTMAIVPMRDDPVTLTVGGIVGSNESIGAISDCFSDSRLRYTGGATVSYSGTVGANSGGLSDCVSDATNNPSPGDTATYSNLRNNSYLTSSVLSVFTAPTKWALPEADGEVLRLAWENRECQRANNLLSVATQVSTLGRGTAINPVLICTEAQLKEVGARTGTAEHYRLATDINLSKWTIADTAVSLKGKFDGGGHALYGLNLFDGMDNTAIFNSIDGTISNLNLFANKHERDASLFNVGILTSLNNGTISNVTSYGSLLSSDYGGGVIASTNTGLIEDVKVSNARIQGSSFIGGVAGTNDGSILRSSAEVNIYNIPSANYNNMGGIVGSNTGSINQVRASGMLNYSEVSGSLPYKIGGLVGLNTGTISNSYTSDQMWINTWGTDGVGGAVGMMSGGSANINTSFSLSKINYLGAEFDLDADIDTVSGDGDSRKVGPLVGKIISGALVINSKYLENTLFVGSSSGTVDYCTGNDVNLISGTLSANGFFNHHNLIGPVPYVYISSSSFTPDLEYTCQNNDNLNFVIPKFNYAEHGLATSAAGFRNPDNFTSFGAADANANSVLNYFLAKMNGQPTPAGTPIWIYETGEKYPSLLQLER